MSRIIPESPNYDSMFEPQDDDDSDPHGCLMCGESGGRPPKGERCTNCCGTGSTDPAAHVECCGDDTPEPLDAPGDEYGDDERGIDDGAEL